MFYFMNDRVYGLEKLNEKMNYYMVLKQRQNNPLSLKDIPSCSRIKICCISTFQILLSLQTESAFYLSQ